MNFSTHAVIAKISSSMSRYYMHGLSMGSLKVLVWQTGDPYPARNSQSFWTVSGEKGDDWVRDTLAIKGSKTSYKVSNEPASTNEFSNTEFWKASLN